MENIALTLHNVADQVNRAAKERQMVPHHLEFVETKIIPRLQEMASKGEYIAGFTIFGYSQIIVCELLRDFGFTTEVIKYKDNGYYLTVKW